MLFTSEKVTNEELSTINNFFETFEQELNTVSPEELEDENSVTRYITSLTTGLYAKSVEDIANTQIGNRRKRKRNFQQIMQESFFSGANRFGNNFIA